MKPGSMNAVMASIDREKAIHAAEMATTAQEMWGPTQGSTHTQKIAAAAAGGREAGGGRGGDGVESWGGGWEGRELLRTLSLCV